MSIAMLWAKIRVLLGAVPALGAVVQTFLTGLATEVVPALPGDWQVKALAVLVLAASWVVTVVKVVARVTRVGDDAVGLLLPPGDQMRVEKVGPSFGAGHIHPS